MKNLSNQSINTISESEIDDLLKNDYTEINSSVNCESYVLDSESSSIIDKQFEQYESIKNSTEELPF